MGTVTLSPQVRVVMPRLTPRELNLFHRKKFPAIAFGVMYLISAAASLQGQVTLPPNSVRTAPIIQLPEQLRDVLNSLGTAVRGVQSVEILTPAQPVGSTGATLVCRLGGIVDTRSNYVHFFGEGGPPRAGEPTTPPTPNCSVTFQPALAGDYYTLIFTIATNETYDFLVDWRTALRQPVADRPRVGAQLNRYAALVGPASAERGLISAQVNMGYEIARASRTYRDHQWYFLAVDILRVIR